MEQKNIDQMTQVASVPVGILKKENLRNAEKFRRRAQKHNLKKPTKISLSQIKKESHKESSNPAQLKRKKSSKASLKKSIDTSDPVTNKIMLCVTVPSPLLNQHKRVGR